MRQIEYSNKFKRDYKRIVKRGLTMSKLQNVLELLVDDKVLATKHRPHLLSGEWAGFSECHIEPDWLLIYDLSNPKVLALHRTGTHSDLFELEDKKYDKEKDGLRRQTVLCASYQHLIIRDAVSSRITVL